MRYLGCLYIIHQYFSNLLVYICGDHDLPRLTWFFRTKKIVLKGQNTLMTNVLFVYMIDIIYFYAIINIKNLKFS